jgi:hypothetical protein
MIMKIIIMKVPVESFMKFPLPLDFEQVYT